MLMAAHSHHPTISTLRAAAGSSTITATSGGAAAGSVSTAARAAMERSGPLRCPRCDSSNTKFCYYNNYSLSQPRHFCKACKRYWTRGGTLRNVPVGGRCRKNKRPKRRHVSSSSTATISSSADAAPITSLSSDPYKPTPFATAAATVAPSVFYGQPSDASQLTFSKPSVPYDLQSLGLFPSNADEDCLPVLKKHHTDHRILQQTAPAASPTPSLASLDLQDSSVFGSNPLASLHASGLNQQQQQQQQQQQRMTQNPHLPQYTTLLSHATSGTSALPSDVMVEDNGEGIVTRGNSSIQSRLISWQMPSCDSALLETIAAESLNYWNAAAASAFGGGSLQ